MNLAFPLQFDPAGRTATAADNDHIAQMIEELSVHRAGQRVNRPDFGSGLSQLVFAPNSAELATRLQFAVKAALQRWLGDLIDLKALDVVAADSSLTVSVSYVIRQTNTPQALAITRTVPTP